jgi:WD40 repeat protein
MSAHIPTTLHYILEDGNICYSSFFFLIFISDDVTCLQTLSFGLGFCLCVRLCLLPGTDIVLLSCAADDAKIHLFAESTSIVTDGTSKVHAKEFVQVDSLVGHEDWIRAMDFTVDGNYLHSKNVYAC